MAPPKKKSKSVGTKFKVVADNRKARYSFFIEDAYEAGIMLSGTEVKSLRTGKASIQDAYAEEKNGELWLINAHIPEFSHGNIFNHSPRRPRKLLMHKREVGRLGGAVQRSGMTLVPLSLYFNEKGRAKLEIGLAKGKNLHDKRQTEKERDWNKQKQRLMKDFS